MSNTYLIKVGLDTLAESASSSRLLISEQIAVHKDLQNLIDAINEKDKVLADALSSNTFRSRRYMDNIAALTSKLNSLSSEISQNRMQISLIKLALGMIGVFGVTILARKLARRFFNKKKMTPHEQSVKLVAVLNKAGITDEQIAEIIKNS